jgi:hypothetical protein
LKKIRKYGCSNKEVASKTNDLAETELQLQPFCTIVKEGLKTLLQEQTNGFKN